MRDEGFRELWEDTGLYFDKKKSRKRERSEPGMTGSHADDAGFLVAQAPGRFI